jgi:hypothetical protein
MTCLLGEPRWRDVRRSSVLERRENAFSKIADEGFLFPIDVMQVDLTHPQGEVLLQPGLVSLRVSQDANAVVAVMAALKSRGGTAGRVYSLLSSICTRPSRVGVSHEGAGRELLVRGVIGVQGHLRSLLALNALPR